MDRTDKCKICRRAGEKLFLKGDKCYMPNCPVTRRAYAPGQHGKASEGRRKISDFGLQLMEKQKAKAIYGITERQMLTYYNQSRKIRGATGETLMKLLELRVDNIVFRLGWGLSRNQARQFVNHGHIKVNGKKVDIASYQVSVGDEIQIDIKGLEVSKNLPKWLSAQGSTAKIVSEPIFDSAQSPINEQLIIEYYSR